MPSKPDRSAIKTYWSYSVTYGYSSAGTSGNADTLSKALAMAFEHVLYYMSVGFINVRIEHIDNLCSSCHGSGKVPVPRKIYQYKKCRACSGVGILTTIDGFRCRVMPDNGITLDNDCLHYVPK
jgi:hypothetical protein